MTTNPGRLALIGIALSLVVACGSPPAQQAAAVATPAPVPPAVSINAIMVALIDHAGHNLWNVEKEGAAPKTDADWDVVEEHAVQLVAAGSAITAGGTGPNDTMWAKTPSWRTDAQQLMEAATAAMTAAQNKNLEALVKANGRLVETCEQCHKEFKPSLPTEGIVHKHDH